MLVLSLSVISLFSLSVSLLPFLPFLISFVCSPFLCFPVSCIVSISLPLAPLVAFTLSSFPHSLLLLTPLSLTLLTISSRLPASLVLPLLSRVEALIRLTLKGKDVTLTDKHNSVPCVGRHSKSKSEDGYGGGGGFDRV